MNIFQPGDKYELCFSSYPRAFDVAGYVEILSVNRIPESDLEFRATSIRGNYIANAGEVVYIVHSESTNTKKKKAVFFRDRRSQEYADEYCGGEIEGEWFSPTKRNYFPISTRNNRVE